MSAYSNYRGRAGSGFMVDSSEQREKARRADQVLRERIEQHRIDPRVRYEMNNEIAMERHTPPPVFNGYEDRAPSYVGDKRAARFRDGLPPPPLPPRWDEDQTRPARVPGVLIPQDQFDAGLLQTPRELRRAQRRGQAPPDPYAPLRPSTPIQEPYPYYPPTVPTRMDLIPEDLMSSDNAPPLTTSQKKRLRKQRAKLRSQNQQPPDLRVSPTPGREAVPSVCPSEEIIDAGRVQFRVRCELSPWPHPQQPHMMKLQSSSDPRAEVFIGWWSGDPA